MKRKPVKRKPLPDPKRIKGVVLVKDEELVALKVQTDSVLQWLKGVSKRLSKWYRS